MGRSRSTNDGLAAICRAVRHGHGAGLPLVRVIEMQAKSGPSLFRESLGRIAKGLRKGAALGDLIKAEGDLYPEIFRELATVGEESGNIPEVFGQLEEYFRLQASLQREFYVMMIRPVLQFIAATLVIALTIFLMGWLAESRNTTATAPIGFGLVGAGGAITFLVVVYGLVAALYIAYRATTRTLAGRAWVEGSLIGIPAIGPCLQALALSRFSTAGHLTLDSSMPIDRALAMSFRATANAAYQEVAPKVIDRVKNGGTVSRAVTAGRLFPEEFLAAVEIGEKSGQLPEVLAKQAEIYREETAIRMRILTKVLAWGVYAMVGIFIIFAILRIAMNYFDALNAVS